MFFSVITKNLNWEISTKNLVTFKIWTVVKKMKNFNIMGVHWKIRFLEACIKNKYVGGELPRKGGLGSVQI